MANPDILKTSAHLVAHCLREIEELFRMVLIPTNGNKLSKSEQVNEILNILVLSKEEKERLRQFWPTFYNSLSKFAHKEGLHTVRRLDEINEIWDQALALFQTLLKALRSQFLKWFHLLDDLLQKSIEREPTKNDLKMLTHHIPANIVTRDYFFKRLENPEWLEPLWERGFFKHPPKPIRDEEENSIRFPPWPEAEYLARMATHKPELVTRIILEMPDTENAAVHSILISAALNLPVVFSVKLLDKVKKWAESPYLYSPEKFGELMVYWAEGGKVNEALQIAHVLLDVLPPIPKSGESYILPEPKPRFDIWEYEEILEKQYLKVVRSAGIPALEVLCDILEKYIRLSREHPTSTVGSEDFSYFWHPAIENHLQNLRTRLGNVLVVGIRDSAEMAINSGKVTVTEVISALEKRRCKVFHRIALYLLRVFLGQADSLVQDHLTNRDLFEDIGVRHEYILLLRDGFPRLSKEAQQTILQWIEEGPNVERFKKRYQQNHNTTPSDEDILSFRERWQWDRLAWISPENLPPEWQKRYHELVEKYGEPEHVEFPIYTSAVWVGPTSPKSPNELKTMTVN